MLGLHQKWSSQDGECCSSHNHNLWYLITLLVQGRSCSRNLNDKPDLSNPKKIRIRDSDLYLLPDPASPLGALGRQEDAHFGQGFPQSLAPIGQVPQGPASPLPQLRLGGEFLAQGDIRDVLKGGEFIPASKAPEST